MKNIVLLLSLFLYISIIPQDKNSDYQTDHLTTIPFTLSYQGILKDNNGNLINGTQQIYFKLYDAETAGTELWTEWHQNVEVKNGVFNVYLGRIVPLNSLSFNVPYWLEIIVNGSTLTPRIELSPSPYSINTLRIQGQPVSFNSPVSGQVLKWNGNEWTPGEDETGSMGTAGGDLNGNYPNPGVIKIRGRAISSNAPSNGQFLKWNGSEWIPGNAAGFSLPYAGTISSSGRAFEVINSGTGMGISGSGNLFGIYGYSGNGTGIFGDGRNYGIHGQSTSNTGTGIYGSGFIGIFGTTGKTNGTGVYGQRTGSALYAGYFEGNVHVAGTFSGTNKQFIIDHPLDPENKILRHSCVESPDMMNIYNGNSVTDASGYASVILPEYFEALNKDFRYQLTVIGQFAEAIIFKEIQNNSFIIQTDKPNVKVSWQVTGIRKDPWAEKNPVIAEQIKSKETQGFYLNPEAYNLPRTRSIEWALYPELVSKPETTVGEE